MRWGHGGEGEWGKWHLLSADQTAALKHAELISIVAPQARFYLEQKNNTSRERESEQRKEERGRLETEGDKEPRGGGGGERKGQEAARKWSGVEEKRIKGKR